MDARKISNQLKAALGASGLSLWELARRAEMDLAVVAAVLGGIQKVPLENMEAVGWALDLELGFVPASRDVPPAGPVKSVVDVALERLEPGGDVPTVGSPLLALGLEVLLASDGNSVHARQGLEEFLDCFRGLFERIVVIADDEGNFRQVAKALVEQGVAPEWFVATEVVRDVAELKGARWAGPEGVLQVVGEGGAAHPGQVHIARFGPPYSKQDGEMMRALEALVSSLTANAR